MISLNEMCLYEIKDISQKLKDEEFCDQIASKVKGISKNALLNWYNLAKRASSGSCSYCDCTLHTNRYFSQYGDSWKDKCKALHGKVLINDLIDHMFLQAKAIMKGTILENDFYIYHDALSLMTSKAAISYMKKKGYWDKLIRPLQGVNHHLRRYRDRVVGNHPYLMPLDSHLNQDLHLCFDYHVLLTETLDENNTKKFSKKTPKKWKKDT